MIIRKLRELVEKEHFRDNLPCIFIFSYLIFLIFLAFYVGDINNAIKIDPVRLYNNDAVTRYYFVHCGPYALISDDSVHRPVYFFTALPFTQFMELIGVSGWTAHSIFISIFSTLTLFALYGIAKKLNFNTYFTMGMLVLVASNPLYTIYSIIPHETMVFPAFIVIGIYFFYRKWYFASLFFISLSSLIRAEGYPILGMWGLYYLIRFRWASFKYIFVAAIPNLIFFLANYRLFGDPLHILRLRMEIMEVYYTYWKPYAGWNPIQALMYDVPPIIWLYGIVFVILSSIAIFYMLRDRKFLPINISIGIYSLFLFYSFFFIAKSLFDKWILPIFILSSIPLTAFLIKTVNFNKKMRYLVAVLFLIMIFTNIYNLHNGTEALGECCDIRSHLPLPVETMNWIKNYTSQSNSKTVYFPFELYTLLMMDNECVFVKNDAKFISPPSPNCTRLALHLSDVGFSVNFSEDSVLLNQGKLSCTQEGYNTTLIGEIKEEGVKIYEIERKTNETKI